MTGCGEREDLHRQRGRQPSRMRRAGLLADDLDEHALAAPAVEFSVEDPLPGAEVEPSLGQATTPAGTASMQKDA